MIDQLARRRPKHLKGRLAKKVGKWTNGDPRAMKSSSAYTFDFGCVVGRLLQQQNQTRGELPVFGKKKETPWAAVVDIIDRMIDAMNPPVGGYHPCHFWSCAAELQQHQLNTQPPRTRTRPTQLGLDKEGNIGKEAQTRKAA